MANERVVRNEDDKLMADLRAEHERLVKQTEQRRLESEIAAMKKQEHIEDMWRLPDPLPHPTQGGGEKILFALKMPNPLKLYLYKRVYREFADPTGTHREIVSTAVGEPLILNGWNTQFRQDKAHNFQQASYALTGVNTAWAEIWLRQNPDNALIESKTLLICNTSAEAHSRIAEQMQDNYMSGMEPLEQVQREDGEKFSDFIKRIKDPRIRLHADRNMVPTMSHRG
jgi:hypothetical protein